MRLIPQASFVASVTFAVFTWVAAGEARAESGTQVSVHPTCLKRADELGFKDAKPRLSFLTRCQDKTDPMSTSCENTYFQQRTACKSNKPCLTTAETNYNQCLSQVYQTIQSMK